MAHYGHIPSLDVNGSGHPTSAYFVRVGAPIATPSPFQIVSPNGEEVTSITVDLSGNTTINSQGTLIVPNGVDLSGVVVINGAPVTRAFKVAYVGVVSGAITVPANLPEAQTISANFAVKAGHTYRVSVQCSIANDDTSTAEANNTILYVSTDPATSVEQVGLGSVQNSLTGATADKAYSAVFVAISDSTTCHIECFNGSTTESSIVTLNPVSLANAPSVLVEDLGLI
jgi:hypothetical protein